MEKKCTKKYIWKTISNTQTKTQFLYFSNYYILTHSFLFLYFYIFLLFSIYSNISFTLQSSSDDEEKKGLGDDGKVRIYMVLTTTTSLYILTVPSLDIVFEYSPSTNLQQFESSSNEMLLPITSGTISKIVKNWKFLV